MKHEQGSIQGSSEMTLALIENLQSVCLAVALFKILRATLYATLKRENASFLVIHGEDIFFGTITDRRCKYLKTDTKLSQVICGEASPL
jgi:hypothetical protein